MRIGMTTGADDYITKPFRAAELRAAVSAQLNKRSVQANLQAVAVDAAVQKALVEQKHQLAKLYEQRLAAELSERWPDGSGSETDERLPNATVLFVDIPNYADVAQRLDAQELADLVKKFYGSANDTVHLFGARHMRFVGEGLAGGLCRGNRHPDREPRPARRPGRAGAGRCPRAACRSTWRRVIPAARCRRSR